MTATRKQVLFGGAAALALAATPRRATAATDLTRVNPDWMVSEDEAIAWHRAKVEPGPALTGNPSWLRLMGWLEEKLRRYGCVDVNRSPWTFTRQETSVWPEDSRWGLVADGRRVPVSNFGANCGLTGPAGVTAPLVLWDPETKPDVAGKIVIYRPIPRPEVRRAFSDSDYERIAPFDSWPVEGQPVPQAQGAIQTVAAPVWDDMTASSSFVTEIAAHRPAGVVFAMNLNRALTAGLYTFRVPEHYDFPSVYLDRATGDGVIADALAGRSATIRVEGERVPAEAFQLIAYLPGRDYGAARDEKIQLRTHTDGPSISQDNGALGLLALVSYFSRVPQRDRPRTLMIELDCRHFMPGAERTWAHEDYFEKHPEARNGVVAQVAMEHLGQIDYVEAGEEIRPSGRSLPTWIYASANQRLIDYVWQATRDNDLPSAVIRSPGRPGVNGGSQGPWYGMSREGQYLGVPTLGVQGDLGAYWAHSAGLERFDVRAFRRQVATFVQLTGFLMTSDLSLVQAPRVPRPA
jgi:hypothetical protein